MTDAWTPALMPDQTGRTALVTGANSGLGLHTAMELARHGAQVLMACRNPERGKAAVSRVQAEVPAASVELIVLDLASLESVRAAAEESTRRAPRLDLLVCNAGLMATPRGRTTDGFETQLGVNHLGHFAFTGLLLDSLLGAPAPRVVVVSSAAHRLGKINFRDLMGERRYKRWGAYGQSKLANLLFMQELGRRAGPALTAAAAHPGYAATDLQSKQGSALLELGMKLGNTLLAQSAEAGAWPSLYAATMPDVQSGEYFGPGGPGEIRGNPVRVTRSAASQDDGVARQLWAVSEELTGVHYDALATA